MTTIIKNEQVHQFEKKTKRIVTTVRINENGHQFKEKRGWTNDEHKKEKNILVTNICLVFVV